MTGSGNGIGTALGQQPFDPSGALDITPVPSGPAATGPTTSPTTGPTTGPSTDPTVEVATGAPVPADGGPGRWATAQAWVSGLPLRTQLVAVLVATLLLALSVTGFGVQAVLRASLVGQIDNQLREIYSQATVNSRLLEGLTRPEEDVRRRPEQFATKVSVPDQPVLESANGAGTDRAMPKFTAITYEEARRLAGAVFELDSATDGSTWRAVVVPVTVSAEGSPVRYPGSVTLALSTRRVDEAVHTLRLLTFGVSGAAIAVFALLGWFAIRRAFRPLLEVEETAAVIAAGDLSRRVPARPPTTEVGRLTASLNAMLSHIESAFRAQEASEARTRRFAADASHELRTPLASIRGFAELYRQGAVPADEVPRTMRRIEDEATRMGGLVEDLLMLARLDEQRPGRSEPVDLTVLAGDAVHDARGLDPTRPVQLVGLHPGSPVTGTVVVGDEDRLRQVVANLVANAIRHTPAGTPVEVAVGLDRGEDGRPLAVLEVRDHGHGLSREQAERIFERFYRADASRQRGRGGGSGLGLSIVAAVVHAHGGQVGVRTTTGGGATFQVRLPPQSTEP